MSAARKNTSNKTVVKTENGNPSPMKKATGQDGGDSRKLAKGNEALIAGSEQNSAAAPKPSVGKKAVAKSASKSPQKTPLKLPSKPTDVKTTGVSMTDPKMTKEAVEAAVNAGKETVETVVKAGAKATSEGVEKAVTLSQEHVAAVVKAGGEIFENYEDVIAFNKDNFEAVVSANTSLVKGIQAFNKEFFAIAQAALEQNAKATQKIFACKSVQEVVTAQNDLVKENYSSVLDKSRKLSDLGVKVAEDSTAPLAARVNVAVEKITKPLAA